MTIRRHRPAGVAADGEAIRREPAAERVGAAATPRLPAEPDAAPTEADAREEECAAIAAPRA
jgi:hypothetical protein